MNPIKAIIRRVLVKFTRAPSAGRAAGDRGLRAGAALGADPLGSEGAAPGQVAGPMEGFDGGAGAGAGQGQDTSKMGGFLTGTFTERQKSARQKVDLGPNEPREEV